MAPPYGVLFPASVVGSLPRPAYVRDLIAGRPPLAEDEYRRRMEAAVRSAVALQEQAGIDILTDGEWWRKSYIGVIAELAHGFELGSYPDGRPYTVVVDRLAPRQPGFIAREVRFLRSVTKSKVKCTLPAPALLGERLWDPQKSAKAYPRRDDFVEACVPVLRRELELLGQEGATIVQIDDPHLCLFVDPEVRAKYPDPDRAADFAAGMINEVVEGVGGLRLAVHLCRRAGARVRGEMSHAGAYDPILRPLNRLTVAFDRAAFKKTCRDGCASHDPAEQPWNRALEGKRTFDVKLSVREETPEERAARAAHEKWMDDLMAKYRAGKLDLSRLHEVIDKAKLDYKDRQRVLSVVRE